MAKTATGKASNFFIWIILILLIFGLAGFGVTNFGGSTRSVGSVGETEIDMNTYARMLQAEMQQVSQATGQSVTVSDAQAMGLDGQVLQRLLGLAALDEAARTAGLSVGDEQVADQILSIPAFTGPDGNFDRQAYEFMLDRNGLSVAEFEEQVRDETARNLLQAALVSGLSPGPAFGDAVFRYISEARSITVAPLNADLLDEPVAPPTEEEIAVYYGENPQDFILPDRKVITYAWLTPEMLAETIAISEEELRAAYEAQQDRFSQPERRMVDRLGFADEGAAQQAADAIAAGETTFAALLEERGLTESDVDMGIVTQSRLGEAGTGVFALEDAGVAGPLPSPIGPALFRVNAILEPQNIPFEEARETLAEEMALERAREQINDEYSVLDDMLAGGATLEDLNQDSDMQLGALEWTGAETDGPAGYASFSRAADAVTADDFPEIAALENGGIFALRLDQELAAQVPPLDEVRDRAAELAAEEKLNNALIARAEALVPQIEGGTDFETLGLVPVSYEDFSRRQPPADLAPEVLETAFSMVPGEVSVVEAADGPVVARLDAVSEADLRSEEAAQVRDAVTAEAARGMAQEILTAVARAVEADAGITTNDAALNAVHTQLP